MTQDSIANAKLGETPNWSNLKSEVLRKIDYIAAAWEKLDAPLAWREKIRRELLMPNLLLLAEFCAAIEEKEEIDADPDAYAAKLELDEAARLDEEESSGPCDCGCGGIGGPTHKAGMS